MATESALRLLPLPAADFPAWRAAVRDRLAGLRAASGAMSRAQAGALAEGILARLLPAGPQTPDHHLWLIVDDAGADQPGADRPGADQPGADRAGAVGHLWLRVRTVSDEVEAFVFDLWVTPDADARGLGRPALLLAEQTARELGAGVLRLNMSRLDTMTMRMIDGLGYEPTASQMILDLPPEATPVDGGPDEAGSDEAALGEWDAVEADGVEAGGVELRPMTPAQFDAFCATQVAGYAADIERSGSASAAEAQEKAVADFAELLPDGLRSPGQLLWMAYAGGDDGPADHVGWLWLQVRADPADADPALADSDSDTDTDTDTGAVRAFILDIEVRPEFRRRGHARSIMRGAEREARDRGAVSIGLSVFGDNHGARALYDSLGYRPTEELLRTVL